MKTRQAAIMTGKVKEVKPAYRSKDGGPSVYVTIERENGELFTGITERNAAAGWSAGNTEFKNFVAAVYHVTRNGNIIISKLLNRQQYGQIRN